MGDFNVEVTKKGIEFDKLDEFCDLYNLTNQLHRERVLPKFISQQLILSNKGNCFQKTKETGLSDFHKLISTFLQSHISRLNHKRFNTEIIKVFQRH